MRIALVSLDQVWLDKESNYSRCGEFAKKAAALGCELVIFPEMTLTGYSIDMETVAEPTEHSSSLLRFESLAREAKVNVIFGVSLIDSDSGHPRNTLCLARKESCIEILYQKIHPFSFSGEDKALQAGSELGLTNVAGLKLGCSVCYDLRFPEMFSVMAPKCDAVINIANWPARRLKHWRALLIARAIENQFYVLGVNRIGTDGNGLQYEKSSMVITPEGEELRPLHTEMEIDVYEIDSAVVNDYRKSFPTVRDKRYALYKQFY